MAILRTVDSARDLGVDSHLTMMTHVSAYYQLRQLRPLIRSLSFNATMLLVQAFISTRLDYCNSLLYGISDNLYRRPYKQFKTQHASTKHEKVRAHHTRPAAQQKLHWLPVRQRVQSKIATHRRAGVQGTARPLAGVPAWQKIDNLCLSLDANDGVRRTPTRA